MKSTSRILGAALLMACSAAFAGTQAPAHPRAEAVAANKADIHAERKQIRAEEKTALAACKSMKGAQQSACKKDAVAKASSARAHLKAAKHA